MITIPPKLKILAGFKWDDDVTIDQIIAALEKANLGSRQKKIQSLIDKRAQEVPNESYDDRFNAVMLSKEGEQLFSAMHRPETDEEWLASESAQATEKFDPQLKEKAKQEFQDLVERLKLEGHGGTGDAWVYASNVDSKGKQLYQTWKAQADLEKKEALLRAQRARGGTGGV